MSNVNKNKKRNIKMEMTQGQFGSSLLVYLALVFRNENQYSFF